MFEIRSENEKGAIRSVNEQVFARQNEADLADANLAGVTGIVKYHPVFNGI